MGHLTLIWRYPVVMRTLTRLLATLLVLAAGGCGEDLAALDSLELRLDGELRPINCPGNLELTECLTGDRKQN